MNWRNGYLLRSRASKKVECVGGIGQGFLHDCFAQNLSGGKFNAPGKRRLKIELQNIDKNT